MEKTTEERLNEALALLVHLGVGDYQRLPEGGWLIRWDRDPLANMKAELAHAYECLGLTPSGAASLAEDAAQSALHERARNSRSL